MTRDQFLPISVRTGNSIYIRDLTLEPGVPRDEADTSKAESSTITVVVKMEPKRLKMCISKQKNLAAINQSFLNSLLDEAPSSEELSEYSLYYKGEKLDETKQLDELEVSSYTFDCVRKARNTIRVFNSKERQPIEIPFSKSISVNEVIFRSVGKNATYSFFLTKRNSAIVLKDDLYASLDVTCTLFVWVAD